MLRSGRTGLVGGRGALVVGVFNVLRGGRGARRQILFIGVAVFIVGAGAAAFSRLANDQLRSLVAHIARVSLGMAFNVVESGRLGTSSSNETLSMYFSSAESTVPFGD